MGVGKMGVGEMGIGKMGVGEMGLTHTTIMEIRAYWHLVALGSSHCGWIFD